MDQQTHTPGPWQIMDDYSPDGRLTIIGDLDGEYFTDSAAPHMSWKFVASLEDHYGETHDQTDANRRLICAAPDLLKALRQCVACLDGLPDPEHIDAAIRAARAAISNAEADQ